ncbi:hypothetical protein GM3708_1083 [Geminocystis sp. NIES-3708]|nr:hypothetical protein GM3708_1083 [Geminocystis sp. NIES-3708]
MGLFFVQNLESISLVFLGFNSLSLPLSFWIILALFAGILSSLIIQVLSNNSTETIKSNQSFSSNNTPPSYNSPSVQSSFKNKSQPEKKVFSSPPIYQKSIVSNNISDDIDSDFEEIPENIDEYNQNLEENITINNIDINPPLEKESIANDDKESEKELTSSPSEDIALDRILKPREASIYSYQSREKTDIKPPLSTSQPNRQKPSLPNKRVNNYQGGIYDAPYRVITPAYNDEKEEKINSNFDDEDEDWDF